MRFPRIVPRNLRNHHRISRRLPHRGLRFLHVRREEAGHRGGHADGHGRQPHSTGRHGSRYGEINGKPRLFMVVDYPHHEKLHVFITQCGCFGEKSKDCERSQFPLLLSVGRHNGTGAEKRYVSAENQ